MWILFCALAEYKCYLARMVLCSRILFCAFISCARVLLMCARFDTIYTPYRWSSSELKHKYPDRVSRTGAPKYFLIIVNAVLSVTIEIGLKWSHCRVLAKCRDIFSFLKIWARLWLGEGAHTLWPDPIKILYEIWMNSLMNNSSFCMYLHLFQ